MRKQDKTKDACIERRKSVRLRVPLKIEYELKHGKKVLEETFCEDISAGGLRLCLNFPVKEGDAFKTLIHFPSDQKPVEATSQVVWFNKRAEKAKTPKYDVGLRYISICSKDRNRFTYLMCELMLNCFLVNKSQTQPWFFKI